MLCLVSFLHVLEAIIIDVTSVSGVGDGYCATWIASSFYRMPAYKTYSCQKLFYTRWRKRPMVHPHEPRPGKDKVLESKPTRNGLSFRHSGTDRNSAWHWRLSTIFLFNPLFSGWFLVGTIHILYNNIRGVKWNEMSWETEEQKQEFN